MLCWSELGRSKYVEFLINPALDEEASRWLYCQRSSGIPEGNRLTRQRISPRQLDDLPVSMFQWWGYGLRHRWQAQGLSWLSPKKWKERIKRGGSGCVVSQQSFPNISVTLQVIKTLTTIETNGHLVISNLPSSKSWLAMWYRSSVRWAQQLVVSPDNRRPSQHAYTDLIDTKHTYRQVLT